MVFNAEKVSRFRFYRACLVVGILWLSLALAGHPAGGQTAAGAEEEIILFDPAKVSPDLLEPLGPEELKALEQAWERGHELYHQPPLDPAEATTGDTILRKPLRKRARGKPVERILILFRWTGRNQDDQGMGKVACTTENLRIELGSLVYLRSGSSAGFIDRESNQRCAVDKPRSRAVARKLEEYFQFFPHLIAKKSGFDDIYDDFKSSKYIVKSLPPDDSPIYGTFVVSYPAGRVESLRIIQRDTSSSIFCMTFLSWNVNLPLPAGLFRVTGGNIGWDDLPLEKVPSFLR